MLAFTVTFVTRWRQKVLLSAIMDGVLQPLAHLTGASLDQIKVHSTTFRPFYQAKRRSAYNLSCHMLSLGEHFCAATSFVAGFEAHI